MMLDSVVPGSHVSSALQRLERELAPGDSLLTLYYLLTGRQVNEAKASTKFCTTS